MLLHVLVNLRVCVCAECIDESYYHLVLYNNVFMVCKLVLAVTLKILLIEQ